MHKNTLAAPVAQAGGGNISQYGQGDFWYDGSFYEYVTPTGLANPGQTTNLLSRFAGGPGLATKTLLGTTTFSLPDYYRTYSATLNARPSTNFAGYIAPGTPVTCTGTVTQGTDGGPNATLTVTTAPTGAGIIIGAIITGGTIPATNSWVAINLTGNGTSSSSTWTITNGSGTAIPTNATPATYTITPIVLTVTSVTSGILSIGNQIYHATTANITSLTFVTALGTGTGGTGTYYVSISQTKGTSGSPITGYVAFMNFLNFNSGDGYRVSLANCNSLSAYTIFMVYKLGSNSGTVGILSTDHNFGGAGTVGEGVGRNGTTYTYKAAGATANGSIPVETTSWHVHTLAFNGSAANNSTRFVAKVDGTQSNLTFTGTVGSTTTPPISYTLANTYISTAALSGNTCTVTFTNVNSPLYNVGQNITLSGWTTVGTANINSTFAVTSCNTTTVSFALSGTLTSVTTKGSISGIPMVNLYVDGNAPTSYTTTISNPNATTNGLLLGELIMYTSALSPSSITAVEKYLKNKWLGTN
jgi:hypothetical protein